MRVLHWKTLLGRRLAGQSIAPLLMGVVLAVCLALSLSGTFFDYGLGRPEWIHQVARGQDESLAVAQIFVHAFFAWTGALLLVIIAAFALAQRRGRRPPEALILAVTLPMAAGFELLHAASWFVSDAPDGADQVKAWTWLLTRLALALPLVCAGLVALYGSGTPRLGRRLIALTGGLGFGLLLLATLDARLAPTMIYRDGVLIRPWELIPLTLFAVSGLFVFPQLHRQRPTVLSHALMISMFPQIFAQIEAALSIYPGDGHSIIAHVDVLIALLALVSGVLFDYVYTQKSREDAVQEYESAQLELRSKTQELVRVDRELVDQDQKRRRAERTLRILEKAVETMSLGVTVSDPEGKILYVNPADARMHGYTVEELLGKNASLYSPTNLPPTEDSDSVFLHPWTRERLNVTQDGLVFPVRLVSDMVRDAENKPMALVTICEDISDRKRIEAALDRRDRILESVGLAAERFLAESSWEASVEEVLESLKQATEVDRVRLVRIEELRPHGLDDTWSVLDSSRDSTPLSAELPAAGDVFPRWESTLRRGQLLQGRVRELPEEERDELEERGVKSFAIVPIFVLDDWLGYLSFEDHDEEREWSPAELEVLRTAARTFGAAMHRKQAEIALASSQAKYQDLLENASDLVQSVSPEGRFQFVNRAWKEALGYTQDEVGKMRLWDIVHHDQRERFAEVLRDIMGGGNVERVEVVFVAKSGRQIYLEGSVNARFVAGEPVATRGIFRDITERTIIDRMKKEFISTVSHELRTPLTSIIASLGLLQSGRLSHDEDRSSELVAVAHRNSNRLLQLINDLLDLQKLTAGKIVYRFQPVELSILIDEVLRGIQAFADSFQIELDAKDIESDMRVWADRDRLIQVLNNLLSNAIKFSPKGERVTLSAGRNGQNAVIAVADRGPGIPEEFRTRLFERFTQVDSSATRSAGGSGLGLSIVKGLVEGMQGQVSLETNMEEGTTFFVELPLSPQGEDLGGRSEGP